MVGPGTMGWAMPQMPKSAIKPRKLDFDLMLTATPGKDALPLAGYAWSIVRSGGSAKDRVVASGTSDMQGKMVMTPMQALRLSVAVAKWPNDLQLWAPGIERPFSLHTEDPDWSEEHKNLHALAALDFSDTPGQSLLIDEGRQELVRAGQATGLGASFQHFKKLQ